MCVKILIHSFIFTFSNGIDLKHTSTVLCLLTIVFIIMVYDPEARISFCCAHGYLQVFSAYDLALFTLKRSIISSEKKISNHITPFIVGILLKNDRPSVECPFHDGSPLLPAP